MGYFVLTTVCTLTWLGYVPIPKQVLIGACVVYVLYDAFKVKRVSGGNPWGLGATTLEWQLPSPPPFHTWEVPPHILGDEHDHAPAIVGHGSAA